MYSSSPDGFIIVLALIAVFGLFVFGPWIARRLSNPIEDAVGNAFKRQQNQREGDNLDYVANRFRDVGLPPDLKAAIDRVPNRPPLPGDRSGVGGGTQTGAGMPVAQPGAAASAQANDASQLGRQCRPSWHVLASGNASVYGGKSLRTCDACRSDACDPGRIEHSCHCVLLRKLREQAAQELSILSSVWETRFRMRRRFSAGEGGIRGAANNRG